MSDFFFDQINFPLNVALERNRQRNKICEEHTKEGLCETCNDHRRTHASTRCRYHGGGLCGLGDV